MSGDYTTMGLYDRIVLPYLIHFACGLQAFERQRRLVLPNARGAVLEIGIGSGHNLDYYDADLVSAVVGLDPSGELRRMARRRALRAKFPVAFVSGSAEDIPIADHRVDVVVVTYALCSIPDVGAALAEARRVLRPTGAFVFCEHGRAPENRVRRWQNAVTPLWRRVAGGCHLNRDIPALIEANGFVMTGLSRAYIPGWKPASYNYWGTAVPSESPLPSSPGQRSQYSNPTILPRNSR